MAADLAVIVISFDEAHWLPGCLDSVQARAGSARLQLIVVDNGSGEGTRRLVAERYPHVELVRCENRGFGHANNRGLERARARHVLFLNVDTEVVGGTLGEVVALLDGRPEIGAAGARQRLPDGELYPTMRRFPSPWRALAEALALDRAGLGERVPVGPAYGRETECDWTTGACLFVRREALSRVGGFDEAFFMNGEDVELCRRIRDGGWRVVHTAALEIVHHVHGGRRELPPALALALARSRRLYADRHLRPLPRAGYLAAVAFGLLLRAPFGPPRRGGLRERVSELGRLLRALAGASARDCR